MGTLGVGASRGARGSFDDMGRWPGNAGVALAALVAFAGCSEDSGGGSPGVDGGAASGGLAGAGGSGGTSGAGGAGAAGGADAGAPRSFALGMTPFPYDVTQAAVDDVYAKLASDADMYAFHTTEGVAWVEALAGEPYGASVQGKWARHAAEAAAHPEHAVYLALTPLDDSRSELADYWGAQEHMALPGAWATYAFDAPEVKAAYLSFCKTAIDAYQPDYLAIGIEVNLLRTNAPASWDAYATLHRETYQALKAEHPGLPIFVTLTAVDLLDGWTQADHTAQMAALADVLPYSDVFALSFYPYMSTYLTEPIPTDTFDTLAALAGGKPIAIAESGYPAQKTELPSFGLIFDGTPQKQDGWVKLLLGEADARSMPFVVQFLVQDYDALWQAIGGGDFEAVWRDTGLYDEAGSSRPSLTTWQAALARPRTP